MSESTKTQLIPNVIALTSAFLTRNPKSKIGNPKSPPICGSCYLPRGDRAVDQNAEDGTLNKTARQSLRAFRKTHGGRPSTGSG